MILIYCVLVILLAGFWIYCSTREHLLSTLLSLEFMVLALFLLLFLSLGCLSYFYGLIYLIITACEGALGLSVLVMMSRTHGGDYFKVFGIIVD